MALPHPLKIGTRGSRLALVQAEQTKAALIDHHPDLGEADAIEIVVIKTTGDKVTDRALAEVGGKGLFAKEVDAALLGGAIDLAVHSMKDVETHLPSGIAITCVLPREDPRDALIARDGRRVADLAKEAVVGTASLRRQAQLLAVRPDLRIVLLRGNVPTRLMKVVDGDIDATLLAVAGLNRLGLDNAHVAPLEPHEVLPAVGQGAIGIAHRAADLKVADLLAPLNDPAAFTALQAERSMLAVLDGSCRTPIGGLASIDRDVLALEGLVALPDGSAVYRELIAGGAGDAEALGRSLGGKLRDRAGPGFFEELG